MVETEISRFNDIWTSEKKMNALGTNQSNDKR